MSVRDKVLHVLALDFAILVAIVGVWYLFVMGDSSSHFSDLVRESNLIKLTIGVVAWCVLYAQHIRTTGDFLPPDPPATVLTSGVPLGYPTPPVGGTTAVPASGMSSPYEGSYSAFLTVKDSTTTMTTGGGG